MLNLTHEQKLERLQSRIAKDCHVLLGINQASNFALWLTLKAGVHIGKTTGKLYIQKFYRLDNKKGRLSKHGLQYAFKMYRNGYPNFDYPNDNEKGEIFHAH